MSQEITDVRTRNKNMGVISVYILFKVMKMDKKIKGMNKRKKIGPRTELKVRVLRTSLAKET
jgi:hypothetical protein